MANYSSAFGFVKRSGDTMSGNLAMGGNKVTGLAAASAGGESARHEQIESVAHNCVLLAGDTMSGNLDMGALDTVDGVDISGIASTLLSFLTGTYTGAAGDDRDIDIGVNLAGMSHVYMIIKALAGYEAGHRMEYSQGDLTMLFGVGTDVDNTIQGLTATGFQVGSNVIANMNGIVYRYMIWYVP